jgi:hypothetical protein
MKENGWSTSPANLVVFRCVAAEAMMARGSQKLFGSWKNNLSIAMAEEVDCMNV